MSKIKFTLSKTNRPRLSDSDFRERLPKPSEDEKIKTEIQSSSKSTSSSKFIVKQEESFSIPQIGVFDPLKVGSNVGTYIPSVGSPNLLKTKETIKKEDVKDESKSDWFLAAVEKAKLKAKLSGSVSHSAKTQTPASTVRIKRENRWDEEPSGTSTAAATVPPLKTITAPTLSGMPSRVPMPQVPAHQATSFNLPQNVIQMAGQTGHMEAIKGVMVSKLTRQSPAIINYAQRVFGSLDLSEAQWKQCEEQMKMNIVFQLLQSKKAEAEKLEQQGKVKYEYDSDEDTEGGTWEHKRRKKEMEKTSQKAEELTTMGEGKHHIGDFLPPEELSKFVEKFEAIRDGRDADMSDYRENRLTEDNVGYKMLMKMGWTEGKGLGSDGQGIVQPVNQQVRSDNRGLGTVVPHDINVDDNEYDCYRKRMMLAYRFRPNPLNNPRRAYY